MLALINSLIGFLFVISLLIGFAFRNIFVWLIIFSLFPTILIATKIDIKNNQNISLNALNLAYFLFFGIVTLSFKSIYNINVFDRLSNNTIYFLIIGLICLFVTNIIVILNPKYSYSN
ncbi:MAG: hypothetical protein J6Y29_06405 [Clostridiales bacterium]|nr:hypothetical protein [Clostridiales bacterium]